MGHPEQWLCPQGGHLPSQASLLPHETPSPSPMRPSTVVRVQAPYIWVAFAVEPNGAPNHRVPHCLSRAEFACTVLGQRGPAVLSVTFLPSRPDKRRGQFTLDPDLHETISIQVKHENTDSAPLSVN